MERSTVVTKEKRMSDGLSLPIQNTIIINIIWCYFTSMEKEQLNSIKKKKDVNNRKMTNPIPWSLLSEAVDKLPS